MKTLDAKLGDYLINILDISNTNSHALAKHEFMNTDGAVIEDMGRRPQEIRFKTFWFGSKLESLEDLSPTYANHFLFIDTISNSNTKHILIHPKFGAISGYVESYTTVYNDTQEYAEIDISFVEDSIISATQTANNALKLFNTQIDLLNAELAKTANQLKTTGLGALLGKSIDFAKSLNSQFNKITAPARNFLKECDTYLTQVDTFLTDIEQPLTTIDAAVNFVQNVPSRLIGSANKAANRLISSLEHLSNLPAQFVNNAIVQSVNFSKTITGEHAAFFQTHFLTICAGSIAVRTGQVMTDDNNNRVQAKTQESKVSFSSSGSRINTVDIPVVLSSAEIETIMAQVRDLIQQIIKLDRDNPQLLSMAQQLISYVDDIKLHKTQQVTMSVNNIPLHLLCLQLGIPYNGANRIFALNTGIKNPTFTEGRIQTYVS